MSGLFLSKITKYENYAPPGVLLPEIDVNSKYYADLDIDPSSSNYDFLRALCMQGVKSKGIDKLDNREEYYSRTKMELEILKDLGFIDSWREQNPEENSIYSWFDYRSRMFDDDPKRGLRIDHILISNNLLPDLIDTGIDYAARSMEKPSDHCPVWIKLK